MSELRKQQRLRLNEMGCMASFVFLGGMRDARVERGVTRRERNGSALLGPSLREEP